jgi:hypothetical protein
MGFTAVGAVLAGTADVATTIAAVGEVGLATSVVGAVTGNSTLTKIGGYMGLASGVGSLANSAFGAATDAAATGIGSGIQDAGNSFSDAGFSAQNGLDQGYVGSNTAESGLDGSTGGGFGEGVGGGMGGGSDSSVNFMGGQTASNPQDIGASVSQSPNPTPNATANSPADNQLATQPDGTSTFDDSRYAAQAGIDPSYTATNANSINGTAAQALNGNSYFDKLANYLGTDKGMNTSLQLGAGLLSGLGQAYNANRNYELNKDLVTLRQNQAANMNDQVKVAKNPGILNSAKG